MEDLRSEDLEELLQELEEEDSTQESPAPDVEELLRWRRARGMTKAPSGMRCPHSLT